MSRTAAGAASVDFLPVVDCGVEHLEHVRLDATTTEWITEALALRIAHRGLGVAGANVLHSRRYLTAEL
jgi:hypothetical protein